MEDDCIKKKKSKKKKGKQSKTSEEVGGGGEATCPQSQDANVRQLAEASQSHHHPNLQTDRVDAAEPTVDLEKKIKDLLLQKDAWVQKEGNLEKKIRDSQHEKDAWLQKEVGLEKKIRDLQCEKDAWSHKEVSMEEKIKQLFHEKSSWLLKEFGRISLSLLALQAQFLERIEQLERQRASWVSEEKSIKETITKLNELNADTIMQFAWIHGFVDVSETVIEYKAWQVKVLQESRDTVLKENQQLVGAISALQSQVQLLESSFSAASSTAKTSISEVEDFKAQLEVAGMLVEKLIVEKVKELCIELNRRSKVLDRSSTAVPDDSVALISQTMPNGSNGDRVSEFQEKMSRSGETLEYQSAFQTKNENFNVGHANNETITLEGIPNEESVRSYEAGDREEIVQIPLDENEIEEVEALAGETDEAKEGATLSDAPLTGAPFRLISFVARYVSGADLVDDKKPLNSSR
ncbi:hypothetical protein Sjap_014389 [Stephania japonica]|uniref:Uncharacterized protein n=1 Tax=Stephania japonica TaxID=461633 RepID=A0AAP0J1T3_9MAGN